MTSQYPSPDPYTQPTQTPPSDRPALAPLAGRTNTEYDTYSDQFERYTAFWDRLDPTFSDWIAAQMPARPGHGDRAIDLGCGGGRHSVLLAEHYAHVLAVDIADGMLGIARNAHNRDNITYQHTDVLAVTPLRNGTFDAVLAVDVLRTVGGPELVLPHIRSLVAARGVAILVDMIDPGGWAHPGFHVDRAFTESRAAYELSGDRHAAADVLRLLLHDRWLRQAADHPPLTRERFHQAYQQAFPGAQITDLNPLMSAAVWHSPATVGPYYPTTEYAGQARR